MLQLQKYTWLIDTIRKARKISLEEISDRWERNKDLSDYKPLSRATFNRWKDAIFSQFGIIISCQRTGGYLYFGSSDKCVVFIMHGQYFKFKEPLVAISISLPFHCFDFVIDSLKFSG